MDKPILSTFGYGMNQNPKFVKKTTIFQKTLVNANIDVLIDTRYNVWGGFWNPKKIKEIIETTNITYVFNENGVKLHQMFGVPKKMRETKDFDKFTKEYEQLITTESILHLENLIKTSEAKNIAIMCCEPFVQSKNNCHRFILADLLLRKKIVSSITHLCMDRTYNKIQKK